MVYDVVVFVRTGGRVITGADCMEGRMVQLGTIARPAPTSPPTMLSARMNVPRGMRNISGVTLQKAGTTAHQQFLMETFMYMALILRICLFGYSGYHWA